MVILEENEIKTTYNYIIIFLSVPFCDFQILDYFYLFTYKWSFDWYWPCFWLFLGI